MGKTLAQSVDEQIMQELGRLGGQKVGKEQISWRGNELILPEFYRGDIPGVIRMLKQIEQSEGEMTAFNRQFMYRPLDGANALRQVFIDNFGVDITGKAVQTMFGAIPPALIDVKVGVGKTVQVPWGRAETPLFSGEIDVGSVDHPEYGEIFSLHVLAPKRYASQVAGLFDLVEHQLQTASIYRGKAITAADTPDFLDLSGVDEERIVYAAHTRTQLEANLWSVIEYAPQLRELNVPIKRAVLMWGPWGTGKTEGGRLTGVKATRNGFTYIYVRPGKRGDDVYRALKTARLYAPAVVFCEDLDALGQTTDRDETSTLLDAFDGLEAKDNEIIVVLTTNHVERIHKGMIRPGRLDSIIEVGALDHAGVEKLIKAVTQTDVSGVNWSAVGDACEGYMPAYIVEVSRKAINYGLRRNDGQLPESLTTDDLVNAAVELRPQFKLQDEASEGTPAPVIDSAIEELVARVVHHSAITPRVEDGLPVIRAEQD
jgi:transitional endoplasmic reticulum ATPase